jgi:hypothetical protein
MVKALQPAKHRGKFRGAIQAAASENNPMVSILQTHCNMFQPE